MVFAMMAVDAERRYEAANGLRVPFPPASYYLPFLFLMTELAVCAEYDWKFQSVKQRSIATVEGSAKKAACRGVVDFVTRRTPEVFWFVCSCCCCGSTALAQRRRRGWLMSHSAAKMLTI